MDASRHEQQLENARKIVAAMTSANEHTARRLAFADIFDEAQLATFRKRWFDHERAVFELSDRGLTSAFESLFASDVEMTPSRVETWVKQLGALGLDEMVDDLEPYRGDIDDEYLPSLLED